ncbi:hypothetical protein MCOR14_003478 [Pyricularia oryzae]|nr:hypothetical protein MCOR17_009660 [Pyricularia oryzae]KAI6640414.1 hypothetical protein MCOR14_003478 [Pyricularia oryzae]
MYIWFGRVELEKARRSRKSSTLAPHVTRVPARNPSKLCRVSAPVRPSTRATCTLWQFATVASQPRPLSRLWSSLQRLVVLANPNSWRPRCFDVGADCAQFVRGQRVAGWLRERLFGAMVGRGLGCTFAAVAYMGQSSSSLAVLVAAQSVPGYMFEVLRCRQNKLKLSKAG